MQADVHRRWLIGLFAAGFLSAFGPGATPACARQAQARLTTTVPAGQHKTVRLRNVPADTRIAIAIQASARIVVSVLGAADAARYPAVREPVFSAPVQRAMSFAVTVPSAGTYYVVFDNARGDEPSKVQFLMQASRQGSAPVPRAPREPGDGALSPLRRRPEMHDM
ncbi:MAG: hypothetical protein GC151_15520 [Betaproteobacteria bacterium]|nr:hypothetical protein [Betaproteobacteria bacterium]